MKKMTMVLLPVLLLLLIGTLSAIAHSSPGEKEGSISTEEKTTHISYNTENFKEKVIQDMKSTFNISWEDYTEITPEYLAKVEEENEVKSLKPLYMYAIQNLHKGDIMPYIYLNKREKKGIMLSKKAGGTNIYYSFKKKEKYWDINEEKSIQGREIK